MSETIAEYHNYSKDFHFLFDTITAKIKALEETIEAISRNHIELVKDLGAIIVEFQAAKMKTMQMYIEGGDDV